MKDLETMVETCLVVSKTAPFLYLLFVASAAARKGRAWHSSQSVTLHFKGESWHHLK